MSGRNKLTTVGVKAAGDGKLFDGGGLQLVKSGGRGKWVYRYSHLGKRREMGLGGWPVVSLADARKARDACAASLARGVDPIAERDAARAAEIAARDRVVPTLAEMIQIVFEARRDGLRGGGDRGRWLSPLVTHVVPAIGHKRMSDLTQHDIHDALRPIWRRVHPTADKALQRLRIVIEEARYAGHDCDPFIAQAARRMLGEVRHQTRHIPATSWQDLPALWGRLDPRKSSGLCLRWMALTLVRLTGCSGARLTEIDGDVWTVPADRIKGREGRVTDFRVPMSGPALEIVADAREFEVDLLFDGGSGRPIGSRALEEYLTSVGEVGRPHGLRTAFRTWVQDTDACSFDVAETILGHAVGGKIERSYARSDLLERRRPVMEAWGRHLTSAVEVSKW